MDSDKQLENIIKQEKCLDEIDAEKRYVEAVKNKKCPVCGSDLLIVSKKKGATVLNCPNPNCSYVITMSEVTP